MLLARQPILDTAGAVHGQELLYRRADGTGWPIEDEKAATAHVLTAAFADLPFGSATSGTPAWVNVPPSLLASSDLSILPADRVVLEILERGTVDDRALAAARDLAARGYRFALDDFVFHPDLVPLLDLATYVKLDVLALGVAGVAAQLRLLAPHDVTVVAEKVETGDERDACLRLGIGLFQGFFFERPHLVRGRPVPTAAHHLRSALTLTRDSTFEAIEQVVRLDVGVSVRLLRYINSAAVALRHRVSSLRQALMLVGTDRVRQWLLLVLLGRLGELKPAVLTAALLRARLCETLAQARGLSRTAVDGAFITGLLSVADALLDAPMDELVDTLPIADEVRAALLTRHGLLGELLALAIDIEHGATPSAPGVGVRTLADACRWVDEQLPQLATG